MKPEFAQFLNPDNFKTEFDSLHANTEYSKAQFEKGLEIGREAKEICIGIRNTWSTTNKDGSSTSSHEKFGRHACTAELLRGFLASPAKITVYRDVGGLIEMCVIKESHEN